MDHPWGLKDVEEKSLRRGKNRKRKEAESKAPPKPPGVVYSGASFGCKFTLQMVVSQDHEFCEPQTLLGPAPQHRTSLNIIIFYSLIPKHF